MPQLVNCVQLFPTSLFQVETECKCLNRDKQNMVFSERLRDKKNDEGGARPELATLAGMIEIVRKG